MAGGESGRRRSLCYYDENSNNHVRHIEEWRGQEQLKEDGVDILKPVFCFAIRPSLGRLMYNASGMFVVKIFILFPEDCSLYRIADFQTSTQEIACASADSKIFLFGGGCGTQVWYMDVMQGKDWVQAAESLIYKKRYPHAFSLNGSIYALDTCYYLHSERMMRDDKLTNGDPGNGACRFEVLDTRTPASRWRPLCNPPHDFGTCTVRGSWTSDAGDGQRLFIEAVGEGSSYLFVYDVGRDTWARFPLSRRHGVLVSQPWMIHRPDYSWSLHLAGKDFAPFPPEEDNNGNLRVFTGMDRSIPELEEVSSQCKWGKLRPSRSEVVMEKKDIWWIDHEEFWSLHCIPIQHFSFWQAIDLGGHRFCTLTFHEVGGCCVDHTKVAVRVANFDITDKGGCGAGEEGSSARVLAAKYVNNKVYWAHESVFVTPLPCAQLSFQGRMESSQRAMPTSQNAENFDNKSKRGRGKNKRFWSRDEEWGLVHLLVELSTDPKWKADGNFKNGYLQKLEKMMNKKFPGCGLTSTQIESKVKQFREKHNVITVMLGTSDFSWDDTNKKIQCERQSYNEFLKKNKNAKGLWGTSFPFLEDLDKVFGADRGNGGACEEDYVEAVETLQTDDIEAASINNDAFEEDKEEEEEDDQSFTKPSPHAGKKTRKGNYSKGKAKKKNPEVELNSSIINVPPKISSFLGGVTSLFYTIESASSTSQQHEQAIMAHEEESEAKVKDVQAKKAGLFHEVRSIKGFQELKA